MRLIPIPEFGLPDLAPATLTPFIQAMCDANHRFYVQTGFGPPWIAYIAVEGTTAIGVCAFKGAPRVNTVEIAYATHPDHEGKGVATRMVQDLVRIARAAGPTVRIIAQTLPERNASTRVLGKCGFTHVRDGIDEEVGTVWEWELAGGNGRT